MQCSFRKIIQIIITSALVLTGSLQAQTGFVQNVKGIIVDKSSQTPLNGANVIIVNSDPLNGTVTDLNGNFILKNVPVGRQSLKVSFIGYQSIELTELIVSSAKELVLKIELEEDIYTTGEVTIRADLRKDKPLNQMALVSARSFTIEETNKYAGSYGDPARMAANYAGVLSTRDNRNDIVVRGNSSMGLQYRMDGIEIANPNHFGALGTTGGPITVINTNLLTNSDFLTGAFPAEYGNALAGIFDLKMRTGNTEKREYWGQMGFNGLEFGTEGPVSKKNGSSYLAAYRYSFVDILEKLGVNLDETAKYQDLNFKLNFPTKKAGTFSVIGIGGTSRIEILDSESDPADWTFDTHGEDVNTGSSVGSLGVSNLFFINENTRIKTDLSFVGTDVDTRIDTFNLTSSVPFNWGGEHSSELKYTLSSALKKKLNAKNNISFGLTGDYYDVSYSDSTFYQGSYHKETDSRDNFGLIRIYCQWERRYINKLTSYLGLNYQYFTLNSSSDIEPRAGLMWEINSLQSLNLGLGMHSQMQPRMMYYVQSLDPQGKYILSNKNLDFSKSLHFIMGYNYLIADNLRLKAESYYQHLYNIPVSENIPQYSILNEGTQYFVDRQDSLINKGTGANYGLELTLEKFMSGNYYFLFTASLFQSKYKGYDEIERSTSFNSNYILNGVAGYELPFGKSKNLALILGLRLTWAGGQPYVPFDQQATVDQGQVVYDWDRAYQGKYDDYLRGSFRYGIRRNEKGFNMQFFIDLQYRANYTYVYLYRIDVVTGEIVQTYKMRLYPLGVWRIQF
jgi:hypothetical protein